MEKQNLNGYLCFYNGKKIEVYAKSSFTAREEAAKILKVKKRYLISVVLCELNNGEQAAHNASDFCS